ncbi:MAG: PorT family protein [Tannerellaceae bacterium]|jgi:hypothetical protein|nr:PorT family protein [Tannerellaceae bacterium]
MANEERDISDDLFRLKLQDIEAETTPEDWEAIVNRLPVGKSVPFRRRWVYGAAAAIAALIVGGGSIYLSQQGNTNTLATGSIPQDITKGVTGGTPFVPEPPAPPLPLIAGSARPSGQPLATRTSGTAQTEEDGIRSGRRQEEPIRLETKKAKEGIRMPLTGKPTFIADATPVQTGKKTTSLRKWGFGMGMGGLTQSSGEVVNTYVLRSSNSQEDEELLALNAASDQNLGKLPRTNIRHQTPLSFGLSVSRRLNDRFSLQTGLVYSLLLSDWETQASAYNTKTRQTLHFVGLPLSLSYRITEWNRFQVYASAGALTEVNVVGRLKTRRFSNDLQTGVSYTNQRMKEWQWSVNARTGISYPLIPYVNAFAEIGAAYYFNNGSETETIYSDKAFNISPQIGLRLSF